MPAGTVTDRHPRRIVCLTEETTETLYLLGEEHRLVGISGFTVRPPRARRDKPRVSAFTSAKLDRILELQPDLVLAFSDMQADIAAALARAGVAVHVFNQRSVEQILDMITVLGALIGQPAKAATLVRRLEDKLARIAAAARNLPRRPRVYFEEWDEPPITAIRWVSELVELAGGENVFADLARESLGKDRIIADHARIIDAQPDIIIGSWCGKKFRPERVAERAGYDRIPAVANGQLHEVKSAIILQPGPAALTEGVEALAQIIRRWAG